MSYAPATMAIGLMLVLWGAAAWWLVSVLGLAIVGIASIWWIRDTA